MLTDDDVCIIHEVIRVGKTSHYLMGKTLDRENMGEKKMGGKKLATFSWFKPETIAAECAFKPLNHWDLTAWSILKCLTKLLHPIQILLQPL